MTAVHIQQNSITHEHKLYAERYNNIVMLKLNRTIADLNLFHSTYILVELVLSWTKKKKKIFGKKLICGQRDFLLPTKKNLQQQQPRNQKRSSKNLYNFKFVICFILRFISVFYFKNYLFMWARISFHFCSVCIRLLVSREQLLLQLLLLLLFLLPLLMVRANHLKSLTHNTKLSACIYLLSLSFHFVYQFPSNNFGIHCT